jgi:multiple sugar transport system substrate-binding protein
MHDRRRAVYPNDRLSDVPKAGGVRLADGTAACFWGNLASAPRVGDPIWNKISLTGSPINPAFSNSRSVVPLFNDWLAVASYSPHVAEAADFLKFLGSPENQNHYNADFGALPPRRDAWTGYMGDPVMQKMSALVDQYGVSFVDVRESAQLHKILLKELPAYFTDAQSLDKTISNIQSAYTQVLRDAGRIR